jgi:curli biogenesis system outer membrane secretion channel CsgG
MIMKRFMFVLLCSVAAVFTLTTTSGCAPSMKGQVKDDTTLTRTSKDLPQTSDVNAYKGPKLRVGVVNFQNKTPSRVIGIGEAAADILGTILQKTNRFIVIPQQDVESILAQQRMGASGIINPDTAAQMGQILGLNAIVTGAVTAYSEAEEGADYLVAKSKKQIARVTVDYRIVDTTTGVQIMADSGAGIYSKSVSKVLGMGSKAGYDPDLRDGALRDALNKAMVNMMQKLENRKWNGRVAQVDGNNLYINAGQKSGLNVGDKLKVFRPGKEIIDPVTKVKLGMTENLIGEAIVQQNDLGDSADLSIAAPSSGTGFKPGDIVKLGR